jgi:hypothetical protein
LIVGGGLVLVVGSVVFLAGYSIKMLSAVRSYVGAESLWSKAQKDAVLELKHYTQTLQESDYNRFLTQIRVPRGDSMARLAASESLPASTRNCSRPSPKPMDPSPGPTAAPVSASPLVPSW